ncbi:36290_t:CDS:2, partial [Gigaspora margarita]
KVESKDTMEALEKTYLALRKEQQDKIFTKFALLHAKSNKRAYAEATGMVNSKRQVKRKTDDKDLTKVTEDSESVLFDESNEDALIDTIDEFGLKEETILLGYWSILDLAQQSLYGCTEFSQTKLMKSRKIFQSRLLVTTTNPRKIQQYFDSNCDPTKLKDKDNAFFEKYTQIYNLCKD